MRARSIGSRDCAFRLDTSETSDVLFRAWRHLTFSPCWPTRFVGGYFELLIGRPCTVNQLVDQFRLNRPAVSEHLQVLRKAKVVRDERRGRERYYHLEPARLREADEWLKPFEHYWSERLKALESVLDEEER